MFMMLDRRAVAGLWARGSCGKAREGEAWLYIHLNVA